MCTVRRWQMKLEHARTDETLKFHFDAWLSRIRKDGQLMRELAANRPQRDTLPRMIRRLILANLLYSSSSFLVSGYFYRLLVLVSYPVLYRLICNSENNVV